MFEVEQQAVATLILRYCQEHDLPLAQPPEWSPIPFTGEWGICTSFFKLAALEARQKAGGRGPQLSVAERAQEIAAGVAAAIGTPAGFARLEAVKGYLNCYYATPVYSQRLVDQVLEENERFGWGSPKGERVMVEFSQPNTHKAFHVGHLRNVILGSTIANILEAAGYAVVRANYLGDIGLHVIKWLWNYTKNHRGEEPGEDRTRWMGDIYAESDRLLDENPEWEAEVRSLFARWDRRDAEVVALWQKTRQWSLEGFDQIYQMLGVRFDRVYFESEVEDPGKELVEELVARNIAVDERPAGPVIVRLDELLGLKKEKFRVLVVLRSDGTSLYATKDLALAIQKFREYPDLKKSIYVIDVRQSLYLQQIFKTLELMGYPWAKDCYHLAYEIVNLPGNVTMSSRDGTVVLLEDLVREATRRALAIVRQKNPSLSSEQMQSISTAVALGALRYTMIARDNTKTVTFDWESALDFNGQAAPYIQYAHVRANSILRNLNEPLPEPIAPGYTLDPTEVQLIDLISRLPGEVQRAAAEYKPLHLTNLAYEIGRAFSDFYNACPVLRAEPEVRNFRLRLVAAARQALANALMILGIEAPKIM